MKFMPVLLLLILLVLFSLVYFSLQIKEKFELRVFGGQLDDKILRALNNSNETIINASNSVINDNTQNIDIFNNEIKILENALNILLNTGLIQIKEILDSESNTVDTILSKFQLRDSDFQYGEVNNIIDLFLIKLNSELQKLNRNYELIQIQKQQKQVSNTKDLRLYNLELFIYETHRYFAINLIITLFNEGNLLNANITANAVEGNTENVNKIEFSSPLSIGKQLITNEDIATENERRKKNIMDNDEYKYECYGGNKSSKNETECINSGGKWDRPVQTDTECLYFKANTNYTNDFGGIVGTGYCENPLGTKTIGFRHISQDVDDTPLCYNCKKLNKSGLGKCCDEQVVNKILYPTLSSPDYAFPNDILVREQQKYQLEARGLNSSKEYI